MKLKLIKKSRRKASKTDSLETNSSWEDKSMSSLQSPLEQSHKSFSLEIREFEEEEYSHLRTRSLLED